MKRYALIIMSFGILLSLSGCIYTNVESPGLVKSDTVFQLTQEDFDILDRVSVSGETTLWFGAVIVGGTGYQALLAEAQKIGGDEIMNYSFDMEQRSVFVFIYNRVKWKATGFAVKFKNKQ